jgi:hypothetical protein
MQVARKRAAPSIGVVCGSSEAAMCHMPTRKSFKTVKASEKCITQHRMLSWMECVNLRIHESGIGSWQDF